jgi:hypothetical protein
MDILLVDIGEYSIDEYLWLLMLLYYCLLVVVILMDISEYSIGGYLWLLMLLY